MSNDNKPTDLEIWIRIKNPGMLQDMERQTAEGLRARGDEEALRKFIDGRAAVDDYWKKHHELIRHKFEIAEKQAALDEAKQAFVEREEREIAAHTKMDRPFGDMPQDELKERVINIDDTYWSEWRQDSPEEEKMVERGYKEIERNSAAQEASLERNVPQNEEERERLQLSGSRQVLTEEEIWLRLNTPHTLHRNIAEYTRQLEREGNRERLQTWCQRRAVIDAAWKEHGEAIRFERTTFVHNSGERDDFDYVAARRIMDAMRDPDKLRALVLENQILNEREDLARRADSSAERALRVVPHGEQAMPTGKHVTEDESRGLVGRVAARTQSLEIEQKLDATQQHVPKIRR